jgi:hypothetical protein
LTFLEKYRIVKDMKKPVFYLVFLPVILMACNSTPATPTEEMSPAVEEQPQIAESGSNSVVVTREVYDFTLADVKAFVHHLNSLIQTKKYDNWKATLSDRYFNYLSSAEFLANASESPLLSSKKIVLKTLNDYFTHVVVPSRSNSRADEIEFTDTNTVKVYYIERRKNDNNEIETRRLRLYELIKAGNTWKIIG